MNRLRRMLRAFALLAALGALAALTTTACSTSSGASGGSDAAPDTSSGPSSSSDAGSDADGAGNAAGDGAADGGPECVAHDGSYTCLGGTWPVCPSSAQPLQPCDGTLPSCMGCSQGAGYACSCMDAGASPTQDASLWSCIGTEHTCE